MALGTQNGKHAFENIVAPLKRWVDNYLGETYGVIPMHRIRGNLTVSQLPGEPALGEVLTVDSTVKGGIKTAPPEVTSAALADHEADTSTHGSADLSQAALKNVAQTFIKKQIIAPDSDTQALDLRVGTGTSGVFRVRNNADSITLASIGDTGKLTAAGATFGSNRIEAVGSATAGGDAVSRDFGDGRYSKLGAESHGSAHPLVYATFGTPAASVAWGVANTLFYVPVRLSAATTVTGIRYRCGTATTGNIRVALYTLAGSRTKDRTTNFTPSAVNTIQDVAFSTASSIDPGLYWAAIISDNTAATFFGWATTEYGAPAKSELQGGIGTPTTITPPAATSLPSASIPWLVIY